MREEIIKTSLERFLKYGIRKMTVQKLISPLGISTKTVYKYFSNKEALLKHCLLIHYAALLDNALFLKEKFPNAVKALEAVWQQAIETDFGINKLFYQDLNYYYPELQDEILKKYIDKIAGSMAEIIQWGMKEGYFRKDLNALVIIESMTIIYSSLTRTDQFRKFKLPPEELARQTILVYLHGVCTNKGLKELKENKS